MKRSHSISFILLLIVVSCSSEKESDLKKDCSGSDLVVSIVSVEPTTCSDKGGLVASSTGGEGAVTFSINGTDFQQEGTFDALSAGNYTVTAMDQNGCTATVSTNIASESGGVTLAVASQSSAGCGSANGSVSLGASSGNGDYTYSKDGSTFQSSSEFDGLAAGDYTFSVKDESGCVASVSATIDTGVSLDADIMPIISANCAVQGCHGDVQSPQLTSKASVIGQAARIKVRTNAGQMPPAGRPDLTQQQIDLIACWVEDGALDN
ncbi:hypothetical protein [Marinoscillum sp. 108]|uniref:hypothetical protein n=1 Tax=Marinoscillum sp. 108 TaxID=2653151 RepID=UPI0012F17582|nr:hypothetical protein [Marinoscillum sp. 108]VXD12588.1 conserved hypothetical protein [Marinoscillum sp. 108]